MYIHQSSRPTAELTTQRYRGRLVVKQSWQLYPALSGTDILQKPPIATFKLGFHWNMGFFFFDCNVQDSDTLGAVGFKKIRIRTRDHWSINFALQLGATYWLTIAHQIKMPFCNIKQKNRQTKMPAHILLVAATKTRSSNERQDKERLKKLWFHFVLAKITKSLCHNNLTRVLWRVRSKYLHKDRFLESNFFH